jgi:orotidine-5'-phosphate decarboxylase
LKKDLRLKDRLIPVIDVSKKSELMRLLSAIGGRVSTVKLGLEIMYSVGTGVADIARRSGYDVMLDTKLMDIPNTIRGASLAVSKLKPSLVTIYAMGGREMLRASLEALKEQSEAEGNIRPLLMAVTVLTSLDDSDLASMGFKGGHMDTVKKLAGIALEAGVDGIICSPGEAGSLRKVFGNGFYIATPGIRLAEDSTGDQKRVNTPEEAVSNGADMVIVGRSITGKADIGGAVDLFLEKIKSAL